MPQFLVTITLGNEAMSDSEHIAEALVNIADKIRDKGPEYWYKLQHTIYDVNGNNVGNFGVKK